MNFTTETPTKPGFYAWKSGEHGAVLLVDLYLATSGRLVCTRDGFTDMLDEMEQQEDHWCRLVPAEEVEKAWRDGFSCAAYASRLTYITADGAFAESRAKRVMEGEE